MLLVANKQNRQTTKKTKQHKKQFFCSVCRNLVLEEKVDLGFKMKLELNSLAADMKQSQATESTQRAHTHARTQREKKLGK